MNDLIIGLAANYDWKAVEPFAVSLVRSGYTGKRVLFAQKLTLEACENLRGLGFELLPLPVLEYSDPSLPIGTYFSYVARFLLIHRYLYDNPEYRFVICADTRDVVFQHNPMVWLEQNIGDSGLVAASEHIYHYDQKGNTEWVNQGFKEVDAWMMSQVVYCSGLISGRADYIRDLALGIYLLGRHISGKIWGADQPAYNALMHQKAYSDATLVPTMSDAYCLNLVVVAFEEYRKKLIEAPPALVSGFCSGPVTENPGKTVSGDSIANMWSYSLSDVENFVILHQYDRMPSLADELRKKYSIIL